MLTSYYVLLSHTKGHVKYFMRQLYHEITLNAIVRPNEDPRFRPFTAAELWIAFLINNYTAAREDKSLLPHHYIKRLVRRWYWYYVVFPSHFLTRSSAYLGLLKWCWILGAQAVGLYVSRELELASRRRVLRELAVTEGRIPERLVPGAMRWVIERFDNWRSLGDWLLDFVLNGYTEWFLQI